MLKRILFVSLFALLLSGIAFPQGFDIPVNTAARHNAMANSGSAVVTGGTAIAMNPAGLAGIKKMEVEATFNSIALMMEAPANGNDTSESLTAYSAIGLFGAGYRLNEMITVGFLLYAPSGGGAEQKDVHLGLGGTGPTSISVAPQDIGGYLIFLEFGPCIAINLPGNIKIGFVYRINYVENWAKTLQAQAFSPVGPFLSTYNELHTSGYGFTGYRIGIQWDPLDTLHFGASYRSFVKMKMEGENEALVVNNINPLGSPAVGSTIDSDVSQYQRYADGFVVGATYEIMPDQLSVHFDYGMNFWSRYQSLITKSTSGGTTTTTTVPFKTYDVHCFRLGAEFWALDWIAVRLGFSYSTQAANARYQTPLSSGSPGPAITYAAGIGFNFGENWALDLSFNYMTNEGSVDASDQGLYAGTTRGDYVNNAVYIGIGGRYRM